MSMSRPIDRTISALLATVLALCASTAAGGEKYVDETSPSGRFQFEAVIPNDDSWGLEQREFLVLKFTDRVHKQLLWLRIVDPRDQTVVPPAAAFVHDSGALVLLDSASELIVVDSATAEDRAKFSIFAEFSEKESETHIKRECFGPYLPCGTLWYFVTYDQHLYFVVRTWWDRRLVLSVDAAEMVKHPSSDLVQSCRQEERRLAIEAMAAAVRRMEHGKRPFDENDDDLLAAINVISREGDSRAIPELEVLQLSDCLGTSGGGKPYPKMAAGEIDPAKREESVLRQAVQLALRRLEVRPRALPCNWFFYETGTKDEIPVPTHVPKGRRESGVNRVANGMKPEDVLKLIGSPDFVLSPANTWEYDMDATPPFTFRIQWDNDRPIVKETKIIRPAEWQKGDTRDSQINE